MAPKNELPKTTSGTESSSGLNKSTKTQEKRLNEDPLANQSLLHIGASCTECHTVDFLPTLCPPCSLVFCSNHISTHKPCSGTGLGYTESNAIAGPSSFRARGVCEFGGCERMSIEGIGGLAGLGQDVGVDKVAKEIRCTGCGGAYCVA